MPVVDHIKTFSIVDLKVATLSSSDVPGALVDLPGIRSMQVTLTTESAELRGDNKVISIVDQGNGLEWSMEAGGLSIAAAKIIVGGTVADSGVTPNQTRKWSIKDTDVRPYFFAVGQMVDDAGAGDVHAVLYKCKATESFELTGQDGEFATPTFGGLGIGRTSDGVLVDLVQHETKAAAAVPA